MQAADDVEGWADPEWVNTPLFKLRRLLIEALAAVDRCAER